MSKKQKTVLNSRSWHSIKPDQVDSWLTSGVDYMVFLISKHNTDFYFGLDKQNRAIECRADQLHPTPLAIKANNWSTLDPQNN